MTEVPTSVDRRTAVDGEPDRLRDEQPAGLLADARTRIAGALTRCSGLVIWALFIAIFSLWIPHTFLSHSTFVTIAGGQAVTLILALGVALSLSAGQYDLSAAQNLGLSSVILGRLTVSVGMPIVPAIICTLAAGGLIGLVNGLLVVRIRLNSFIATLGTSSVLLALTELISSNNFIGPLPSSLGSITSHSLLGIPAIAWYAVVLCFVVWYLLEHSPFGRRIYATGANPDTSRLAGIRTDRNILITFALTGLFAAIAGVLAAAQIGEVSPTAGPSYLLPAFAACFLGTTQLKLGQFNVWGTFIAIYMLATGVEGLQLVGGQNWVTDMFNGVALVAAVSVAVLSQRRREQRAQLALMSHDDRQLHEQ